MQIGSTPNETEHLELGMTSPPRYGAEKVFINEDEIAINEDGIYGGRMDIRSRR